MRSLGLLADRITSLVPRDKTPFAWLSAGEQDTGSQVHTALRRI
jgi:hypothetical protein